METPSVRQSAITTHSESELQLTNKQPSLIAVNTTGRYKKQQKKGRRKGER